MATVLLAVMGAAGVPGTPMAGASTTTTRYAEQSGGATSGTCSSTSPCTLSYALSGGASGDTISLAAGTYAGGFSIPSGLTGLTIEPTPGVGAVTLTGGGTATVLTVPGGTSATVEGLTIADGAGATHPVRTGLEANMGGGIYDAGTLRSAAVPPPVRVTAADAVAGSMVRPVMPEGMEKPPS